MSADWPLGGWGGEEGGRCGFFLSITSSCALRDPRRYRKTSCERCEEERGMGSAPVPLSYIHEKNTKDLSRVGERERTPSVSRAGAARRGPWARTEGRYQLLMHMRLST